jgi:hypothetical protein
MDGGYIARKRGSLTRSNPPDRISMAEQEAFGATVDQQLFWFIRFVEISLRQSDDQASLDWAAARLPLLWIRIARE